MHLHTLYIVVCSVQLFHKNLHPKGFGRSCIQLRNYGGSVPPFRILKKIGPHLRLQDTKRSSIDMVHPVVPPPPSPPPENWTLVTQNGLRVEGVWNERRSDSNYPSAIKSPHHNWQIPGYKIRVHYVCAHPLPLFAVFPIFPPTLDVAQLIHSWYWFIAESPFLASVDDKLGGALVLSHGADEGVELVWAHTTESMCIAYMSSSSETPKVRQMQWQFKYFHENHERLNVKWWNKNLKFL